jgi:hypothetical protein
MFAERKRQTQKLQLAHTEYAVGLMRWLGHMFE